MAKYKPNIEFHHTKIASQAKKNVKDVLNSTWLNEGKYVKEFERKLKEDWGLYYPAMTNSCTSALHLSLVVAGVGPGDEVILPAQTFIATGMAILMVGAKPVFTDIDPNTGNMATGWQNHVTEKTKAVIPVHWGGMPCHMDSIKSEAKKCNIEVIEDAAHAFGATYVGRPIGTFSKFTCFSFQAIKFITSGDGGCVCTTDEETHEELVRRKWFGFDKSKMMRRFEGDRGALVNEIGYKYNMNDFTAAMGVGNLSVAEKRLLRRRYNAKKYESAFRKISGINTMFVSNGLSSYWLFTMRVKNRHDFIQHMRDKKIPVSVLDRRIDEHPVFGGITKGLHGQRLFDKEQISIPVHDGLSDEDVNYIIDTVKKGW